MMFSLADKTAVITGAGSGIGRAIALLFAKQGAAVAIVDRDEREAQAVVKQIESDGGIGVFEPCDVSDWNQVESTFERIAAVRGPIQIVVNNAGVAHVGNVTNTSSEDFERVFNVNVKGVFHGMRAGVPHLLKAGGGVMLNLASTASMIGLGDRFAYSMSKGAVLTMTYSVAKDYVRRGIRCNALCPARIHTPFVEGFIRKNYEDRYDEMFEKLSNDQPIGRMGRPEEVAAAALFLCSDEASYVTGCAYGVDGGTINLR